MSSTEYEDSDGEVAPTDLLYQLNECKERNRLRLLNLKRMVKVFITQVSQNKEVLPNYNAQLFKELKQLCQEVFIEAVRIFFLTQK